LLARVNFETQAVESACAQDLQITYLRKDDFINRGVRLNAHDGEAKASGDLLSVRHHECQIFLLTRDAQSLKDVCGNPGVFTSPIQKHLWDESSTSAVGHVKTVQSIEKVPIAAPPVFKS
jgi:hypothetical protein